METIEITLDGVPYQTYLDDNGVQRFVPNEVVVRLLRNNGELFEARNRGQLKGLELYSLNEIAFDYHTGKIPLADLLQFYTMMDYSVSGMMGLSFFEDIEVKNPLWGTL